MSSVGLLYVGAVLILNGVMSLGLYPRLREPRASVATAPASELRWGQTVEQVGRTPARTDGDAAADVEQSGRRPSDAPADRRR